MSLSQVLELGWKSDHILGHIYAGIDQILKGSQTKNNIVISHL